MNGVSSLNCNVPTQIMAAGFQRRLFAHAYLAVKPLSGES